MVGFIFLLLLILRIFNISFIVKIFDYPTNFILESNSIVISPFKNTLVYLKNKKELEEKVKKLEAENIDLKLKNLLNQNISQEFDYFTKQFGTFTPQNNLFKVILKPPFTPFDVIRVSGPLGQYSIGDFVFYKNILIGKVVEKDARYATVELFSTPDKKTPIMVKGTQFEAKGLGDGHFVFEASKDFEIQEGDPIIYPEEMNLILGVVGLIESKEEDLFKKIYFNIPTPINSISYITIGIQQYEQTQPTY